MSLLNVQGLSYSYIDGDHERVILNGTDASFEAGKFYSITGESGSGKTTFLYLIAGLDENYKGDILFNGQNIREIGLDSYRRNDISMIFQNYNLIPYLSSVENLYIAADITDNIEKISRKDALKILNTLGINREKANRKASSLSGGEQQRVAIARSLVMNTPVIVADEPTGNLDHETSIHVIDQLRELTMQGKCVIMVTHNQELADMTDVIYRIEDQKLVVVY